MLTTDQLEYLKEFIKSLHKKEKLLRQLQINIIIILLNDVLNAGTIRSSDGVPKPPPDTELKGAIPKHRQLD